mmetsp:Transcript_8769/g.26972  ORF Transcript_8769/g.26972 Transcript_8769/m.26972 type:complete len:207 (+) Transcript_8769:375-995(+)
MLPEKEATVPSPGSTKSSEHAASSNARSWLTRNSAPWKSSTRKRSRACREPKSKSFEGSSRTSKSHGSSSAAARATRRFSPPLNDDTFVARWSARSKRSSKDLAAASASAVVCSFGRLPTIFRARSHNVESSSSSPEKVTCARYATRADPANRSSPRHSRSFSRGKSSSPRSCPRLRASATILRTSDDFPEPFAPTNPTLAPKPSR